MEGIISSDAICDTEITPIPAERWHAIINDGIYEFGSLRVRENGISLMLINPPGDIGVFDCIEVIVDGQKATNVSVRVALKEPDFHPVSKETPLEFCPGERIEIRIDGIKLEEGRHRFDIILYDSSIPEKCWVSFIDEVI